MKLKSLSVLEAEKFIARELNCYLVGEGVRISAISECLRAMMYICSQEHGVWQPIPSIRLTNMVRHRLRLIWNNLDDKENNNDLTVLDLLNDLHDLGDMVRLHGGRWLPAPPHVLNIDGGKAILFGGGALNTLPSSVIASIRVSGRVRIIEQAICDNWAEVWSIDEWIGLPYENLDVWSVHFLKEATKKFVNVPDDLGEVLIYLKGKWMQLTEVTKIDNSLNLCKTVCGQNVNYFIGEFNHGRAQKLASISFDDAKRLRFYLDARYGRPIRLRAVMGKDLLIIKLKRSLPKNEAKVLLLGWQNSLSKTQHSYEKEYTFPVEIMPVIRKVCERLRIVLEECIDGGVNR